MKKDFYKWAKVQQWLHYRKSKTYFKEREIWWCALGVNIGFEQDGSERNFVRPVVVLKKFHAGGCLVVPLSTTAKRGVYYVPVGLVRNKQAMAIISQLRFVDRRRLLKKIGMVDPKEFRRMQTAIRDRCL